ncbi:hypothetical protein OG21DRAFT_1528025 [Imleria badia]|nr:hypothetical protein OG21DRAFT_1528025 [Imleria badia]
MESGVTGWEDILFLKENVPIAISVRYGQNQPVCKLPAQNRAEEVEHCHRIHMYTHMRAFTFALATHIQSIQVSCWETISVEVLEKAHGNEMYDFAIPEERSHIDLHDHPLLDNGCEIHIFNAHRLWILRYSPPSIPHSVVRSFANQPFKWSWTTKAGPNIGKSFSVPTIPILCGNGATKSLCWTVSLFHSFKSNLNSDVFN